MSQIVEDLTCSQCGCVCDDLIAEVQDNQIIRVENGCSIAKDWLVRQRGDNSCEALLDGKEASLSDAIAAAGGLLSKCQAPLVLGPSTGSTESQRAAIELAEHIGGTFDPGCSTLHRAGTAALQQVGLSTATLGEIKNRADLVLFWRSDPAITHPRFVERFVDSSGTFVPQGRHDRQVIVIDDQRTTTADLADQYLELNQPNDLDLIGRLRAALRDKPIAAHAGNDEIVSKLAADLKKSRYAALLFGANFLSGEIASAATEALFQLVAELNSHTRCIAAAMGGPNPDEVLTWQTGYPLAVNFAQGFPRYNAEEFSADRLLSRGEVDAVISIGGDAMESLGEKAKKRLAQLPVVSIGSPEEFFGSAQVSIGTGVDGIHYSGSIFRMDDVALPLKALLDTALPSQASILRQLKEACQK